MNHQLVYDFLATIPEWKVVTYKIIADKFGIHPRYAARILSKNHDWDTFPCYKVVHHDGKLWGYTHPLWVAEKVRRLEKDWIEIINSKVDKKYFWL